MSIALGWRRGASRYCTRLVVSVVSTPMKPLVLALANPSSPHSIVLAPGDDAASPFWALSSEPPPGSLLWTMELAQESNFDEAAVPGFMTRFGGEVDGDPFAKLAAQAFIVAVPPVEAYRWLGFVSDPVVETLSMSDIARRTGIPYGRLSAWSMRKGFPEPISGKGHPRYRWVEVEAWLCTAPFEAARNWAASR